jgi:hypothetical protein
VKCGNGIVEKWWRCEEMSRAKGRKSEESEERPFIQNGKGLVFPAKSEEIRSKIQLTGGKCRVMPSTQRSSPSSNEA